MFVFCGDASFSLREEFYVLLAPAGDPFKGGKVFDKSEVSVGTMQLASLHAQRF